MACKKQAKKNISTRGMAAPGTISFRLFATDPGDESVGIPFAEGPILVTLPEWMVDELQAGEFERDLATFLSTWLPDGQVLTSWEKEQEDGCDLGHDE